MRAIEMASANRAVTDQHLAECRDRYIAVDRKIGEISDEIKSILRSQNRMIVAGGGSTIILLLTVIGYLLAHGGIPLVHS